MRRAIALLALELLFADATATGATVVLDRTGPAEDPGKWPDWGGTPDMAASTDTGMTDGELKALLTRLGSPDANARSLAADEIVRDAPGSEPAFRSLLFGGHGARNARMKAALLEAAKRAERANKKEALLEELLTMDPMDPQRGKGAVGALRILTMLTALNKLNTLAAYKVMIDFSPRHAGVFRHEIGRMLVSHGLEVMPALVYGRGSKNEEIHMFSVKWIRDMGNPLLSEQVKLKNPRRLAQLLEAYASVNELDAIDVTLSLTNHKSVFVRRAARSALRGYGRNALWPARRKFENTFNEEPKGDLPVEKILEKLYAHYDRKRLAATEARFKAGLKAYKKGDLAGMEEAFREVLLKEPLFPKRGEMAEGFLALSRAHEENDQTDRAREALQMARWVSEPGSELAGRLEARQLWLEAQVLAAAGLAAPGVYRKILELDPDHEGAKEMLDKLAPEESAASKVVTKAIMVSFIIFLASTLVYLRIRSMRRVS